MDLTQLMYYQKFHINLPDHRGGFPPKDWRPILNGALHVISKKEFQVNDPQLEIMLAFAGGQIVKRDVSRPFTEEEFQSLPRKFQKKLESNGFIAEAIPDASSPTHPFQQ